VGLTGVRHTGVTVSNMERSLEFYRDRLGMTVVAQQLGTAEYLSTITRFQNVQIKFALLKVEGRSDHILELLEYVSHPGEPHDPATNRPGNGHLCFEVDDLWEMYERLRSQGVRFKSEPVPITAGINTGAHAVYLWDPDGFTLESVQPPSPAQRPPAIQTESSSGLRRS
jgi:catechol 2,3-dioxygenase-like lactoylglutathione lyase family enzyme